MKSRTLLAIAAGLVLVLLVSSSALAMSSTSFRLDWFTPLSGSGGGLSRSTSYIANVTVGQVAAGSLSSASYRAGLGYWYGAGNPYAVYLPLVLRQ